jgi:hypothetical protein
MSLISGLTFLVIVSLGCTQSVRGGTLWIQLIYFATLAEALLYSIRYMFVPNDLLVIAAATIEAQVVVMAAYILASICIELYATTNIRDQFYIQIIHKAVLPLLGVMCFSLGLTFIFTMVGDLGSSQTCHQLAWALISSFRAVCVLVCAIAAGFIQHKMNLVEVSEGYRQSKTRTLWCVATIFILATMVELGNDAWGIGSNAPGQVGECWEWASVSIDQHIDGDTTLMLVVRVLVRAVKFFLPMWTVMVFFKALKPERQVRDRTMSWASGGVGDDEWSTISGYQPPQTSPLSSDEGLRVGSGGIDTLGLLRHGGGGVGGGGGGGGGGGINSTSGAVLVHHSESPTRLFGSSKDLLRNDQ